MPIQRIDEERGIVYMEKENEFFSLIDEESLYSPDVFMVFDKKSFATPEEFISHVTELIRKHNIKAYVRIKTSYDVPGDDNLQKESIIRFFTSNGRLYITKPGREELMDPEAEELSYVFFSQINKTSLNGIFKKLIDIEILIRESGFCL